MSNLKTDLEIAEGMIKETLYALEKKHPDLKVSNVFFMSEPGEYPIIKISMEVKDDE